MKAIDKVSIKTRIISLVLIPLIATLFLGVERYQSARADVNKLENLGRLQEYIYHVSPLISALQNERLYTGLYLGPTSPSNPVGLEFKQDMLNSRQPTDVVINNYLKFIDNNKNNKAFTDLKEDFEKIKKSLLKISETRGMADERLKKKPDPNNSGKKTWTILSYKLLTNKLIDTSKYVVLLTSGNELLSLLSNSYQNLLSAQNVFMLQVASINSALTNMLSVTTYGGIVAQYRLEGTYINNFSRSAPERLNLYFKDNFSSRPDVRAARANFERIRKQGKALINTKIDLDQANWLADAANINRYYDDVIEFNLKELESTKSQLLTKAKSITLYTLLGMSMLVFVLVFISYHIVVSINSPLKQLINDLSRLASSKDMTIRSHIDGHNELSYVGNAFNSLIESFEQTLSSVREQIVSMGKTTDTVSVSMNESIALINNQKSATDEISVSINEMTNSIHEVSKMSSDTSETVKRAYDMSLNSEKEAKTSKEIMDRLFSELGDTSGIVSNLNEEASQISSILQVIKGISEQTNLLALNAAIEAARAGDMGRGFAVVADEVRSLSKRTQDSTAQIQSQIEALIQGAESASQKMIQLQQNGSKAVDIVQKSTSAFSSIRSELDDITDMASQIAVVSEEQTNVSDEINNRIHTIKNDSDNMRQQGLVTLDSTRTLIDDGSVLREKIEQFHFK